MAHLAVAISMLGSLGPEMTTSGDSCLCECKGCRTRELWARLSEGYLESVSEIPGLRCPMGTRSPRSISGKTLASPERPWNPDLLGSLRGYLLVSNPKSALYPAPEGSWCDGCRQPSPAPRTAPSSLSWVSLLCVPFLEAGFPVQPQTPSSLTSSAPGLSRMVGTHSYQSSPCPPQAFRLDARGNPLVTSP